MKRGVDFLVLACVLFLAVGCTASRGFVTLSTVPSGAEVYVDGVSKGFTPLTFDFDVERRSVLKIEMDGYFTEVEDLNLGWVRNESYKGNFDKEYDDKRGGRIWKVRTTRALKSKF
ncbi:MAG: PEGA domain-containing protein [Syntrophobacteraceae bacterium]